MKTKSKISKQEERKTNSNLVATIREAKKNKGWLEVASLLSRPRRKRINLNLSEIDKDAAEGDKIVVAGKVLSQGDVSKKVKVIAHGFSENAKEKLLNAKCEVSYIDEEIKSNPDAKGIKILKAELKNPTLSKTKGVFNKWK